MEYSSPYDKITIFRDWDRQLLLDTILSSQWGPQYPEDVITYMKIASNRHRIKIESFWRLSIIFLEGPRTEKGHEYKYDFDSPESTGIIKPLLKHLKNPQIKKEIIRDWL